MPLSSTHSGYLCAPSMTWLIVGLILFFGIHSIEIVRPGTRTAAIRRLGSEGPWKAMYALVSIIGLAMIVYGYGLSRYAPYLLYTPPGAGRHLAMLLMVPVFPLILAAYLPGRIAHALCHPMLIATVLWACAHLLANGNLADVLLFGVFGLWALADIASLSRRPKRSIAGAPAWPWNDLVAVVSGLLVYAAFLLFAHRWLIGVPLLRG
ncbi:NnrU family protein [Verticiella sediminum]|nr:NnrU family protein [Verticiella sediminum]